jgi:hypothetical protein
MNTCIPFDDDDEDDDGKDDHSKVSPHYIKIGIHKYDYTPALLQHLKDVFFTIQKASPSSYILSRSFYCSSVHSHSLNDDWRKSLSFVLFFKTFYIYNIFVYFCIPPYPPHTQPQYFFEGTSHELYNCMNSEKMYNIMNIQIQLIIYDENDSGQLVYSTTTEGNDGRRESVIYKNNMKLIWIDWMGRRWRIPKEEEEEE